MNEHEKRGATRVAYVAEVVCESAGNRLTARTSDISASGIFIHSKLWCEAGSTLTLSFLVSSTRIETLGEVCYSIPYIGMGIRFMDLKPEHREAIERLIESQEAQREFENDNTENRRIISSGVEPVDKLLGGLERGNLYLAHGDASGKSLFGIQFLIEGLKRGQPGAIVTPHRREDAVRRFSRLGYDCQPDFRSGALVFFRYSNEIVEQIQKQLHLEPLLRELGPVLDQSSPERIVFDPVDNLLAGAQADHVTPLANQLAVWVRSFDATVLLVANGEDRGVIESLTPSVKESFRFEVRENSDRVVRFMTFEKSPSIPDQAVKVDPSRGISMVGDPQAPERSGAPDGSADLEDGVQSLQARNDGQASLVGNPSSLSPAATNKDWELAVAKARAAGILRAPLSKRGLKADTTSKPAAAASNDSGSLVAPPEARDAFFAMLDELQSFVSSIDPEEAEAANDASPQTSVNARIPGTETAGFQTRQLTDRN